MPSLAAPDHRHPHRTWLHLLPTDPELVPSPACLERARRVLIESGIALAGPEAMELQPGPRFTQLLSARGIAQLPLAGSAPSTRGEIRIESGILRCYPDPGPNGFDTDPPNTYLGPCPHCGAELEFFTLRFPYPDPMTASCPSCAAAVGLRAVSWVPELAFASSEVTFGDLDHRPSLAGTGVCAALEEALGASLREVHVTL